MLSEKTVPVARFPQSTLWPLFYAILDNRRTTGTTKMKAIHAHPRCGPSPTSMSVIAHIPREPVHASSAVMPPEASPLNRTSRMNHDHHAGSRPPISFVEELLVNGMSLRIPMAASQPGHARVIQAIARLAHRSGGFQTFGASQLLRAHAVQCDRRRLQRPATGAASQ